jgi:hypothetical protein
MDGHTANANDGENGDVASLGRRGRRMDASTLRRFQLEGGWRWCLLNPVATRLPLHRADDWKTVIGESSPPEKGANTSTEGVRRDPAEGRTATTCERARGNEGQTGPEVLARNY